jgi:hypothetical protein
VECGKIAAFAEWPAPLSGDDVAPLVDAGNQPLVGGAPIWSEISGHRPRADAAPQDKTLIRGFAHSSSAVTIARYTAVADAPTPYGSPPKLFGSLKASSKKRMIGSSVVGDLGLGHAAPPRRSCWLYFAAISCLVLACSASRFCSNAIKASSVSRISAAARAA